MPLESLKEKGQNSTIIEKLRLWLEETSLRAQDSHMLTTEGSLAERKVRPGVSQCSGLGLWRIQAVYCKKKKKSLYQAREQPKKRQVQAGAPHQSSGLPLAKHSVFHDVRPMTRKT